MIIEPKYLYLQKALDAHTHRLTDADSNSYTQVEVSQTKHNL